MKKWEVDKKFYDFYFKKISIDLNIPIEKFISPTNSKANTDSKTINN